MAYVEWKKNVFDPIQSEEKKLTQALLKYIERARADESIDKTLARKVVDALVRVAVDDREPNKTNFAVYTEDFETPFMNATKEHIKTGLKATLSEEDSDESVALEKVGKVIEAEVPRVAPYLPSTEPKDFVRKCLKELITDQALGSDPFWTEERINTLHDYIEGSEAAS